MRRFVLFFCVVVTIVGLCGYYLGNRLLTGAPFLIQYSTAVWSGVITFLALVVLGPLLSRILPQSLHGRFYPIRWAINMTMAIFFAWLFYTFATDVTLFLLSFLVSGEPLLRLQESSLLIIAILVVGTLTIGSWQALAPKIYRIDVSIANLPAAFDGFKIAQISDLHIGEMIGHRYVRVVVEKTNELDVDVIALTGDIIDGSHAQTASITRGLAQLKARDGAFYVTGNHEYYWGVQHAIREMEKIGARVLMNESVLITRGESEIAIVGIPDISARSIPGHSADPHLAVRGLAKSMIKILLSHQPVSYRLAMNAGVHLLLAGHTHGGQFFPWSLVVRLFQHYNKGLIRHEDLWIYVNRGTATWGPRLRFGIPPEITLLTLRPG